jgi:hypothetical protein
VCDSSTGYAAFKSRGLFRGEGEDDVNGEDIDGAMVITGTIDEHVLASKPRLAVERLQDRRLYESYGPCGDRAVRPHEGQAAPREGRMKGERWYRHVNERRGGLKLTFPMSYRNAIDRTSDPIRALAVMALANADIGPSRSDVAFDASSKALSENENVCDFALVTTTHDSTAATATIAAVVVVVVATMTSSSLVASLRDAV